MPGLATPITLRAQSLALLEAEVPVAKIIEKTGLAKSTIYRIKKVAYEQGFNPSVSEAFKDEFFKDASRSSWPKAITEEITAQVLKMVKKNW
jgi:hypothetical protein